MDESQKIDFESESDGFNNTSRISENQVDPNINELEGIPEFEVDTNDSINADDQLPQFHDSTEPEPTKRNGRYNLRKSLAWDSAFFSSAGVLDSEELSSMITGANKAEKSILPGIEEDVTLSTESFSTLQSDNLTLESLEDDLFLDIRASIQRSSKNTSSLTNSNRSAALEVDNGAISSLEKEDLAPQNKDPKPALKKTSGLQSVRTSKCQPKQTTGNPGSGKALQQGPVRSQMTHKSAAQVGESNSVLPRPPKAIRKPIPATMATTKRDSVGTDRAKSESANPKRGAAMSATASSKGIQSPKASVVSGARKALAKPAVLGKSSSLRTSTSIRVQSMRSSTSSESSSSIISENPTKPPLMAARRNPVKGSNAGTKPSGSVPRTSSKSVLKNKLPSTTPSACIVRANLLSSVSPASSISEWSSTSSSSSKVNRRSNNSITSLDASSCRSIDGDTIISDLKNLSTDQNIDVHKSQEIALPGNNSKKFANQTGSIQALVKPSGLRLPSPKLGFFDGVKGSAQTPNRPPQSQSGLRTVFPKSGAAVCRSPTGSSNIKLKSSKVLTAKTVSPLATVKSDALKSPKVASALSFREKPRAPVNDSHVPVDVTDALSLSFDLKGNAIENNCQKAGEIHVEDGGKQLVGIHSPPQYQSSLRTAFPKSGAAGCRSPTRSSNSKLKSSKVPAAKTVSPLASIKPDAPKSPKVASPLCCTEKPYAPLNDSHVLEDITDSLSLSVEHKGNAIGDNCQMAGGIHVEDGVNQPVVQLNNETDLNTQEKLCTGNMKWATIKGSNASGKCMGQEGEDVLVCPNDLNLNLYSLCYTNVKESGQVKYEVEGLHRHNSDMNPNITSPKNEVLSEVSDLALSFPATGLESSAYRAPFAVKNIYPNDECDNMSKETLIEVEDNVAFVLPTSDQKENS